MPRLSDAARQRIVDPIGNDEARELVASLPWLAPLPYQERALRVWELFPDARVATFPWTRQGGKTTTAHRMATEQVANSPAGETDLYVASTYIDLRKPWRLTEHQIRTNPDLGDVLRAEKTACWAWGAYTQYRHGAGGEIGGETIRTQATLDESGKLTDELHDYMDPMFRRFDSRKINWGTPRGYNRFHDDYIRGLDVDGNSPLLTGKPPVDSKYISMKITWHDVPWHSAEDMERARQRNPLLFRQEYEADFLSGANTAFPDVERLHDADMEEPVRGGYYAIGYDPGRKVDRPALSVLRTDGDIPREVSHWRGETGMGWETQFRLVAELVKKYPAVVTLDATGIGDVVLSNLRGQGLAVEPVVLNERENLTMAENMVATTELGNIRFLKKTLGTHTKGAFEEMRDWRVEIDEGKGSIVTGLNFKYGHAPGKHDDSVSARMLAARRLGRIMTHVPVG